ncbi:MAG: phosphoenolpyruvate--protein phosphotransferase [Clostridia bacterium]|nr:phosphoenolpyruvate--protein phosphotransferase [Clostridia bacterium]
MRTIRGTGIGTGAAIGRLCWLAPMSEGGTAAPAGSPAEEEARFRAAAEAAQAALQALYDEARGEVGEEAARIFSIHAMIAADEDFTDLVLLRIGRGESAEGAVIGAARELADRFRAMNDDYLRERAEDFGDIAARLCDLLSGGQSMNSLPDYGEPLIIAARDLTPSQTVGLDRTRVAGFVTAAGSPGSHTAILARSMSLPALVAVGEDAPLAMLNGRRVMLDAAAGELIPDPTAEQLAAGAARAAAAEEEEAARESLIALPAVTAGGRRVRLGANIGLPREATDAVALGADGVGLMRSEFLYLGALRPPGEEEQLAAYRSAAEALGELPLIIRTLDIGADKRVDYLGLPEEENPALGLRAIRLCLAGDRTLFRTQLRAICRAAGERAAAGAGGQVAVMFPMITLPRELDEALAELEQVQASLAAEGYPTDPGLTAGMMMEVPAAALRAEEFASRCAFFSVGSNDLIQYTMAADRQNAAVAPLAAGAPAAVLDLIGRAARAIHETGGWCGLCGELAADPAMTAPLLELGIDELSVSPAHLLRIKAQIRQCP